MKDQYNFPNRFAGKTFILIFLAGLLFFSFSCVSNKQAVYVQPTKENKVDFHTIEKKERTIRAGDELYIRINSDKEETNIFSQWSDNTMARTDITLASYRVNEDGTIRLPPIGFIQLKGLTLEEASSAIEKTLIGTVSQPSVTIKFVYKTITVLGEVSAPGRYEFSDQRINIFQALGYAGDISYYGNRKKIMVLREKDNEITRHYIDLTDEDLIGSYYYYILPNDVIYVEPLKRRKWGFQTFPFALAMGIVSTTLVLISFIQLHALR